MEQKRIPLQIKALNEREFEGYGSMFGNVDLGGDVVVRGAFRDSLKRYKAEGALPLMFWAHDPAQVPGAWKEMEEDSKGLYVKGTLADTQLGNEVRTLLSMKAVRGLSIGFSLAPNGVEYDDDGTRIIKKAELWEVSVVSLPMNPRAQVAHAKTRLSAAGEYVPTAQEVGTLKRNLEAWLRSQGLSKAAAITYASAAFRDDDGVMPELSPGNGVMPDPERRDAVQETAHAEDRLKKLADAMLAQMINRKVTLVR